MKNQSFLVISLTRHSAGNTVPVENAWVGSCYIRSNKGQSYNGEGQKVEPEGDIEAPEAFVQ